jgi:CheY-like chemotaxis protein
METEQIVPLVRSSFPKHVELILKLEKALPAVEVDRAQFQQLVMNLLINAAEAIDGSSGKVTVATYARMLSRSEIDRDFAGETMHPGPYAVLEVRDDGHGMDAETQAKIFDPFFTTKFTGRGLGLAAVIGIAKGHKGAIRVTSTPGSGSTFRLFLPATGAPLHAPSQRQTPVQERGKATVLVVDDEEIVRKLATNALTLRGYRVLLATNGREALEVFAANLDVVTAIVLDLTMPVMSGEDALPRLRSLRPDVRILASSGYSQSEAVRRFGDAIDGFIQKPYSVQSLLTALQETLQPAVG